MSTRRFLVIGALLLSIGVVWAVVRGRSEAPGGPTQADSGPWKVSACRYGTSSGLPHRALVRGASSERHPMGWYFWLLQRNETTVLVDTGFASKKKARRWDIADYRTPTDLLAAAGVRTADVDHIVLTHTHWDHVGGVSLFPKAQVWIRAAELAWLEARTSRESPPADDLLRTARDSLRASATRGLLHVLADDEETEPVSGLRLMPHGGHTPGSQWVVVEAIDRPIVLASDNAYLYENLERPVAVGTSVDADGNLRAIRRMLAVAGRHGIVVPGHDPEVANRFPEVAPGVHLISSNRRAD